MGFGRKGDLCQSVCLSHVNCRLRNQMRMTENWWGLNSRHFLSHSPRGRKYKVKVSARLGSGEASSGLCMAPTHCVLHGLSSVWRETDRHTDPPGVSSSYKTPVPSDWVPPLRLHSALITSNTFCLQLQFPWGLGRQHTRLRGHNSVHTSR